MTSVLITGAGGTIGQVLRDGLAGRYDHLRLLDRVSDRTRHEGEEFVVADIADRDAVDAAVSGMDVVVHLAAIPHEADFPQILEANVTGTFNVLEAARSAGTRRVVFASTNHVVGFYETTDVVGPDAAYRPDTHYGVSKVFGEALARLYHDKWGLEAVCVRIGSFRRAPTTRRELSTWLSYRDATQLFRGSIETPGVGFLTVYGVSNNRRRYWENGPAADAVGFHPADDAEDYAHLVDDAGDEERHLRFHGGVYTEPDHTGGY